MRGEGAVSTDEVHPDLRRQREITGYGPELEDALERYYQASAERGARTQLLANFASWMEGCPAADHLCFADFFFMPPSTKPANSLAFVITPRSGESELPRHEVYWRALKAFWGDDFAYALATHEQFGLGLPWSSGDGRAESGILVGDLSGPSDFGDSSGGPATLLLELVSVLKPRLGRGEKEKLVAVDLGAPFAAASSRAGKQVEPKSLSQVWDRWKATFLNYRTQLSSSGGRPLKWLLACPVGYRSVSETSHYSRFAIVFAGFDAGVSEREVIDAFRYMLLHLYESNAASIAEREGKAEGMALRLMPTAHEVDHVINAIAPDLSLAQCEVIKEYLKIMIAERDEVNPFDMDHLTLRDQIWRQLERSTALECIVDASKGTCATVCMSGHYDTQVVDITQLVRSATRNEVPAVVEVIDPMRKLRFSLAVVAALRNAVRHTFFRRHSDPSLKIYVEGVPGSAALVIENSFRRRVSSDAPRDKPMGTAAALLGFAREYGGSLELVGLQQIGAASEAGGFETWETRLPFPPRGPQR